jgi:hypothetical protein
MAPQTARRTQPFRIIAQDPAVRDWNDRILTASVDIPLELLLPGPWGHRVQVIDFDSASNLFYLPARYDAAQDGHVVDPYATADPQALVADRRFHAQNVYAIVMRTLARFEQALGRRVSWAGNSHQLKLVPHAFADANAFYSRDDEALLLGYFPAHDGRGTVYTCLSHDVVAHETTHALLDGLRSRFIYPSSPDQAAFHEGFADIVALLSVFSLPGVVRAVMTRQARARGEAGDIIPVDDVAPDVLKQSALLGLADEMGRELQSTRGEALRRSVALKPSPQYYLKSPEFLPAHRRGEILVAAVMNAFIRVWSDRLGRLGPALGGQLNLDRVVEEGENAADYLLTMAIRALDYMPPLHIEFCDYLSALVTADLEIRPDDSRYRFRDHLRESFGAYGIKSASGTTVATRESRGQASALGQNDGDRAAEQGQAEEQAGQPSEPGAWSPADALPLSYDRTHFEPMTRDPDEVFWFIWENRLVLGLDGGICDEAFSKVLSVRPCLRIAPDGFVLKETVAEFYQVVRLRADELKKCGISKPADMPPGTLVPLYGGGTLIFSEYGRLKYYIHNSLDNVERQERRIADLWRYGALSERDGPHADFARTHRLRAMDVDSEREPQEEW